jgi:hypothetical protein
MSTRIASIQTGAITAGKNAFITHGGVHIYNSPPEREETFVRKCLDHRDSRVGNPRGDGKQRLGEIFFGRTPAKLPLASFTALHLYPANCWDEGAAYDFTKVWDNEVLLKQLNCWEPPANWRRIWKLEKCFNKDGLLLFHDKVDYADQYIQFHQCGMIEAVDHGVHGWALHTRTIPGTHWENGILNVFGALIGALHIMGGATPMIACLSIRDSLEYMTVSYDADVLRQTRDKAMRRHRMGIKEDMLTMQLVMIKDFEQDLATLIRPWFDALARAGGLPKSPN